MGGSVAGAGAGGGAEAAARAGDPPVPVAAHIDPAQQIAFLRRHYLSAEGGFVREGGAKIKLVIGATGAGKTHFLADVAEAARREGFLVASIDARAVPLGGFDLLYQAVAAGLDFAGLARRFVGQVLADSGYGDPALGVGQTLGAWAATQGHELGPLRVKLAEALHRRLCGNPDLDYGYALGLMRWCEATAWGGDGGSGEEGPASGGLLEHWLRGGRVAVRDCNRLRLRRSADRYTARLWLRSLLHFIRMAGLPGLVGAVDGLEILMEGRPRGTAAGSARTAATGAGGAGAEAAGWADGGVGGPVSPLGGNWGAFVSGAGGVPRYTKQRRDDFYEALRALIDDMGLMPGFLLVLAGPPALVDLDNGKTGFKSYPALAERVENEVETVDLNHFADEIVLERLWAADPEAGRALAEALVTAVAPGAGAAVRQRAVAAARAQWAVRDVAVSAVRRSVLAVLGAVGETAATGAGSEPAGGEVPNDVSVGGTATVMGVAAGDGAGAEDTGAPAVERPDRDGDAGEAGAGSDVL